MKLQIVWMLSVGLLLVVGTLGCGANRSSEEKAAIAAIEKLGGKVTYDDKSWARSIIGVRLRAVEVTDADLMHFEGLTSLMIVTLSDTQVTDAGLEHLNGLTSLLALELNNTQITDAGLEHLKGLTSLEFLSVSDTQVTVAGINELKKALPNCEVLH